MEVKVGCTVKVDFKKLKENLHHELNDIEDIYTERERQLIQSEENVFEVIGQEVFDESYRLSYEGNEINNSFYESELIVVEELTNDINLRSAIFYEVSLNNIDAKERFTSSLQMLSEEDSRLSYEEQQVLLNEVKEIEELAEKVWRKIFEITK